MPKWGDPVELTDGTVIHETVHAALATSTPYHAFAAGIAAAAEADSTEWARLLPMIRDASAEVDEGVATFVQFCFIRLCGGDQQAARFVSMIRTSTESCYGVGLESFAQVTEILNSDSTRYSPWRDVCTAWTALHVARAALWSTALSDMVARRTLLSHEALVRYLQLPSNAPSMRLRQLGQAVREAPAEALARARESQRNFIADVSRLGRPGTGLCGDSDVRYRGMYMMIESIASTTSYGLSDNLASLGGFPIERGHTGQLMAACAAELERHVPGLSLHVSPVKSVNAGTLRSVNPLPRVPLAVIDPDALRLLLDQYCGAHALAEHTSCAILCVRIVAYDDLGYLWRRVAAGTRQMNKGDYLIVVHEATVERRSNRVATNFSAEAAGVCIGDLELVLQLMSRRASWPTVISWDCRSLVRRVPAQLGACWSVIHDGIPRGAVTDLVGRLLRRKSDSCAVLRFEGSESALAFVVVAECRPSRTYIHVIPVSRFESGILEAELAVEYSKQVASTKVDFEKRSGADRDPCVGAYLSHLEFTGF